MDIERPILNGRELSDDELAQIKQRLESLDVIMDISNEMLQLIAWQWPQLLVKITPAKPQ